MADIYAQNKASIAGIGILEALMVVVVLLRHANLYNSKLNAMLLGFQDRCHRIHGIGVNLITCGVSIWMKKVIVQY
jgi:hypothetical protein